MRPAFAEDAIDLSAGAEEYRNHCAVCHGEAGDGPLAESMTVEVPGLTQISANNDGRFPVVEILEIIDGRTGVRGHGYPMPVWGKRFRAEADETWGPIALETITRQRLLELTFYLQTIQK